MNSVALLEVLVDVVIDHDASHIIPLWRLASKMLSRPRLVQRSRHRLLLRLPASETRLG